MRTKTIIIILVIRHLKVARHIHLIHIDDTDATDVINKKIVW